MSGNLHKVAGCRVKPYELIKGPTWEGHPDYVPPPEDPKKDKKRRRKKNPRKPNGHDDSGTDDPNRPLNTGELKA